MDESTVAVLLIHPDPEVHNGVTQALGSEFAVVGARSLELGLKIAARRAPQVAIVDAELESHTPEEVAAELRGVHPSVRLVLLAAQGEPSEAGRLTALGTLVPKPFDPARLRQAVKNAVRLQGMSAGVERLRTRTGQFSMPPEVLAGMPPPPKPKG